MIGLSPRRPAITAAAAARARCTARGNGDSEPPAGAGWFDSSYELLHGLQVQEHDALEGELLALAVAACLH